MKSSHGFRWVMSLLALGLAGCATPYQKSGIWNLAGGGFGEKKISESAYWVYFEGNGFASSSRVMNFWIYRCAELTLEHGYVYMSLRPGEAPAVGARDQRGSAARAIAAAGRDADGGHMIPTVLRATDEPRMVPVHGGGGVIFVPGGSGGVTMFTSKGTVLMYHAPLPEEVVWALDAKKVRDALQVYVQADGNGPEPDLVSALKVALVAHERIEVDAGKVLIAGGGESVVAPVKTEGGAEKPPVLAPRGAKEIVDRIESQRFALHQFFREKRPASAKNFGGTVTLAFDVSANGVASNCRVVSTTFATEEFPRELAANLCRIPYRPKDVADTSVQALPISFEPE